MISLLLPTRKRLDNFKRFYDSAMLTANNPEQVEIVAYISDQDETYDDLELPRLTKVRGPRMIVSNKWNQCVPHANSDYFGLLSDDFVFITKGWDLKVREAIDQFPDKIAFVYGDDGDSTHNGLFGTYGFIHRNWYDVVGYATAPYFSSDFWDTWFNDVAGRIERYVYVPIHIEHMHFSLGKAELDEVKQEMMDNHKKDDVDAIYAAHAEDRVKDAEKLKEFINGYVAE